MPLVHMADAVFAQFARVIAPVAVAALWQGAVVAIALALCLRIAPRVSAAHRFAAWAAGFVVVACLQFLSLIFLISIARASGAVTAAPLGANAVRPLFQLDSRWGFVVAALWLAASGFRASELMVHSLRLRRLWKGAIPIEADGNLRSLISSVPGERLIEICTTLDLDRPSVIGFFAPRILIPKWLYSRLTPGELEQVVLHEAEHLRRRDDWTNLIQKLSLVFFPLNPALAWVERQLCREREMACDEGVVRRTQAPRAYAACLATLAERELQQRELLRRAQVLSLGAFERRPELVRRVHSILRRKRALHPLAAGALVGVVCCGLVLGSVELAKSPQLVAFVAAPEADAQVAALAPQSGPEGVKAADAVFHPTQRIHLIETKATPSVSHDAMAHVGIRSPRTNDSSAGMTKVAMNDAQAAPREILVNATAPKPAETAGQSQEFVVLTAWEEVQTSAQTARTIADYDTGASEQDDAAAGQPDASQEMQITFTRLILVVYPASAVTSAQPVPTTGSPSHRPAPSYDGWLFFQL